MAVEPIPSGYHSVTPYLIVAEADKLIDFLKQAFGAEERFRSARPDGSVAHAEMSIGDSVVMIGGAGPDWPQTSTTIHLYTEDCDATFERAIEAGAESVRKPEDQFYGDRMAGVRDSFGTTWWIATHIEDVSPEEIARRAAEND